MSYLKIPRVPRYIQRTLISGRPTAKAVSLALICLLFIYGCSLAFWQNTLNGAHLWPAVKDSIFNDGEYWRLFSAIFVHGDIGHYLSNSLMFFIFGVFLNSYFGAFIFPFMVLVLGAATNYLSIMTYPGSTRLIGASGMVYVMAGLWLALYVFIDRRYKLSSRLIRAIAFTLVVLFPSVYEPTTSYRTHAIGLVLGVVFGCIYFMLNKAKFRKHEVLNEKLYLDDISDEVDTEVPY